MTKEQLLLVQLAEECAEVQHIVCKALRFGLDHNYSDTGTNRKKLVDEIRDILGTLKFLEGEGILDIHKSEEAYASHIHALNDRIGKIIHYLKLSKELGVLKE